METPKTPLLAIGHYSYPAPDLEKTTYVWNYMLLTGKRVGTGEMIRKLDIPLGQNKEDKLKIIHLDADDLERVGIKMPELPTPEPLTVEQWENLVIQFEDAQKEAPAHVGATRNRVSKKLVEVVCEGRFPYYKENPFRWEMNFMQDHPATMAASNKLAWASLKMIDFVETHKAAPNPDPEISQAIDQTFPNSNWRLKRSESAEIRRQQKPDKKYIEMCDTPDEPGPTGFVGARRYDVAIPVGENPGEGASDCEVDLPTLGKTCKKTIEELEKELNETVDPAVITRLQTKLASEKRKRQWISGTILANAAQNHQQNKEVLKSDTTPDWIGGDEADGDE